MSAYRIDDVGEAPCQDCPHVSRCRLGFACERFRAWSRTGIIDPAASRAPRRAIYRKIYRDEGEQLVDVLLLAARAA
jgi:hypothetical protein